MLPLGEVELPIASSKTSNPKDAQAKPAVHGSYRDWQRYLETGGRPLPEYRIHKGRTEAAATGGRKSVQTGSVLAYQPAADAPPAIKRRGPGIPLPADHFLFQGNCKSGRKRQRPVTAALNNASVMNGRGMYVSWKTSSNGRPYRATRQ